MSGEGTNMKTVLLADDFGIRISEEIQSKPMIELSGILSVEAGESGDSRVLALALTSFITNTRTALLYSLRHPFWYYFGIYVMY